MKVQFNTYKVWANISRLNRESYSAMGRRTNLKIDNVQKKVEGRAGKNDRGEEASCLDVTKEKSTWMIRTKGCSYANMAKSGYQRTGQDFLEEDIVDKWKGMRYMEVEDGLKWVEKGYVGKVHNIDEVSLLQQKIMDFGILSLEIMEIKCS